MEKSLQSPKKIQFSLEFFPPKQIEKESSFWQSVAILTEWQPNFISITCSNQDKDSIRTQQITTQAKQSTNVPVAAHMTLVYHTPESLAQLAKNYWEQGVRHIVALRGDVPPNHAPHPQLKYATDLIKILKKVANFEISVAGYPEKHPEATSLQADIENLKKKVDLGANRVITQFFFDPEVFLRYQDAVQKAGINVPVIPGILPILDFPKLVAFAQRCQANIPQFLFQMFHQIPAQSLNHKLLAMNVLSHQITRLQIAGVTNIHLYTLNEITLTYQICRWIQLGLN